MEIGKNLSSDVGERSQEYSGHYQATVNPDSDLGPHDDNIEVDGGKSLDRGETEIEGYVSISSGPVVTMDTETMDTLVDSDVFVDKSENSYDTSSNSESDDTQIWVPSGGRRPASSLDSRSNLSNLSNHGSADPSTPRGNESSSPVSPPRTRLISSFKNGGISTTLAGEPKAVTSIKPNPQHSAQFSSSASQLPSAVSPIRRVLVSREDRSERVVTLDSEVTSLPNGDSGIGNDENSPGQDEAFLPGTPPPSPTNKRRTDDRRLSYNLIFNQPVVDSLFVNLSGLYAMLIVVLGAILPIAEIFTKIQRPYLFQGFYIYLYGVSVIFILFIYVFVLKSSSCKRGCCSCCTRNSSKTKDEIVAAVERSIASSKFTIDCSANSSTGSFYLRLGAVAFGIGSMIKSGLQFGIFFENNPFSGCQHLTFGFRPILHLFFTFTQLYFVFLNSKVCFQQYKLLSRFGLMHLVATNICVWLENIIHETLIEIKDTLIDTNNSHISRVTGVYINCNDESIMNTVVEAAGPYLYPCSIEYSLICAGILIIMWSNVGRISLARNHTDKNWAAKMKASRLQGVDCSSSSRGLFLGIFLVVAVVINIIAFFVMIRIKSRSGDAVMVEHLSEIICYVMTSIAVIIAFYKMQHLGFRRQHEFDLEQTLLVFGMFGIYLFSLLSIIAASFSDSQIQSLLIIISSVLRMFQATLQTVLMLNTLRRYADSKSHEQTKPGREFVTFLLVANIALWGINTFEVQQTEANPIQMNFYGLLPWSILTHISSPLAIFYRFHSTVCLANIWKHAWKRRVGRF